MDAFYEKNFNCEVCEFNFKEYRLRKSQQRVIRVDSDFATHTNGPNPLFYTVSVCPICGYSITPSFSSSSTKTIPVLQKTLLPSPEDFSKERSLELAIISFQRAIWCAFLNREKPRIIAGLYMHLAWMYRFGNDEESEKMNMRNALDLYIEAYQTDRRIPNMGQVAYLIGELYHRLGEEKKAVQWFSRVISEFSSTSPKMAKMARNMWQEVKEEVEARKKLAEN